MNTINSKEEIIDILKKMKKNTTENVADIDKILSFILAEKYGLVFERHNEKTVEMLETNIPILQEDKVKEIKVDDSPCNFLIEGENLHCLKLLEKTYINNGQGLIDVIYIDPPYNTNKNFIYNDKLSINSDTYKHSYWLSFMNERLLIARKLLSDNGIIFISIDENESAQLKLLCDDIFGEKNYISQFMWKKSHGGSTLSKHVRSNCENIYCYAKNLNKVQFEFFGAYAIKNGDSPLANAPNKYSTLIFPPNSVEFKSIKNGEIKIFKDEKTELHNNIIIENHFNKNEFTFSNHWKWQQEKLNEELKDGTHIISKTKNMKFRYIKTNTRRIIKPTQFITPDENVGYTISGSHEVSNILNKKFFDYPKPVSLIKYLLKMVTYDNPNAIVLDFFAGSGTTGQAVMELNKEDNGCRKFILCTNNENNICEEITYQRLKTIITGIRPDGSKYSDGLKNNLKYFKCEFIRNDDKDLDDYLSKSIIPLIELQNRIFIDYKTTAILINNKNINKIFDKIDDFRTIYVVDNIQLNPEQLKIININNIKLIKIKNYFSDFCCKHTLLA